MGETAAVEAAPPVALEEAPGVRPAKGRRQVPALVYGFDVQFLVEGQNLEIEGIRSQITAMGDCALVEGDPSLAKVHVHVPNPGVPLSYAVTLGFVTEVIVENMDDMPLPEMPPGFDPLPPRQHAGSLAVEGSEARQPSSAPTSLLSRRVLRDRRLWQLSPGWGWPEFSGAWARTTSCRAAKR